MKIEIWLGAAAGAQRWWPLCAPANCHTARGAPFRPAWSAPLAPTTSRGSFVCLSGVFVAQSSRRRLGPTGGQREGSLSHWKRVGPVVEQTGRRERAPSGWLTNSLHKNNQLATMIIRVCPFLPPLISVRANSGVTKVGAKGGAKEEKRNTRRAARTMCTMQTADCQRQMHAR